MILSLTRKDQPKRATVGLFWSPLRAACSLWAGVNPDFFKGTAIENEAAALIREEGVEQQSAAAGS
jgi:hypothetical protein